MPARCVALIVAAGRGERLGADLPKQYLNLAGLPVLRRSVMAFLRHPAVDEVVVVINPAHRDLYDTAVSGLGLPEPVSGGATRQQSVLKGLEALATAGAPALVLIHDAARPLVDAATIDRTLAALGDHAGAIAATPLADTLKRGVNDQVSGTVDRSQLWRARTPQGFRFTDILAAHQAAQGRELTDDSAVAELAGLPVALVLSNPDNLKITHAADLARAERLIMMDSADIRVGTGFDVHRFVDGDHLVLNGVRIPYEKAFLGHSDADVGLHAITDALLGAIGDGDIGQHFPPSDPQWAGADSARFLQHAAALVRARGGVIAHIDVTIICERPKVGPHRAAMVDRIAAILALSPDRVSVKATTTEQLGFTGRREGVAAQAVATVRLPFRAG